VPPVHGCACRDIKNTNARGSEDPWKVDVFILFNTETLDESSKNLNRIKSSLIPADYEHYYEEQLASW
jgi:tRNA nucleotidyltransferase (CCA-adding enzyme)